MQLVELHEHLEGAGDTAVVGLSYDPVSVLARFANERGVQFPLLSDVGSRVLTRLGLVNDLTDADLEYWGSSRSERHDGLPHPGVFVLDEGGIVVEKRFERSHRNRISAGILLAGLGDRPNAALVAEAVASGVAARASTDQESYFPNQIFEVEVVIEVEEGRHVYVEPVPEGYQPLRVSMDVPDGIYWQVPDSPSGERLEIPALGETFHVVDGMVEFTITCHIHEAVTAPELTITVEFQSCDDTSCDVPASMRLSLPVGVRPKG